MGSITNFLEDELLDHVFNAAFTPASSLYLALCTADPTDAATGASCNEVPSGDAYARQAISFNAAASRTVEQSALITFPEATGDGWGTVSHWAIVTSGTYGAGDCYAYGAFATSKTINAGNTASVASGEIDIIFSANEVSNYLANKFLDFAFRNQTFTKPDTYVALVKTTTVADTDTGSTITEPSGGSYGRKQVNPNGGSSPTWDLSSSQLVDNTHDIAFTTATGDWGTIIAVAICDAATLGNLLFYDNAMADLAVNTGDTAKFLVGNLDITLD